MSGHTTLETLTAVLRDHLRDHRLAEPWSVTLELLCLTVVVQVDADQPGGLAELLAWGDSLTDVTAKWWHTPSGNLHITITGKTRGGTVFRVFGGLDYQRCEGLVPLALGASEGVSLEELRTLAGSLPGLAEVLGGAA